MLNGLRLKWSFREKIGNTKIHIFYDFKIFNPCAIILALFLNGNTYFQQLIWIDKFFLITFINKLFIPQKLAKLQLVKVLILIIKFFNDYSITFRIKLHFRTPLFNLLFIVFNYK